MGEFSIGNNLSFRKNALWRPWDSSKPQDFNKYRLYKMGEKAASEIILVSGRILYGGHGIFQNRMTLPEEWGGDI